MLPWKLFFRFFSALVLFATGGFAAGHDLPLPFTNPPAATAPAPVETTTTTAAPAGGGVSDPAPPAVDGTTTTTTAPSHSSAVDITDVTGDGATPATPAVPVTTPPAQPATTTTTGPAVTPDPVDSATPPAVPVDGDAPSVCAAAATAVCGPADPAPTADDSHAARVQRCQDWWHSLADAFEANNRPEWATRARQIADRCDAMITRWEQMEQQWEARHPKGDHNNDGHPDTGWHNGPDGNHPAPPAPAPAPKPQPQPHPNAKQVSRHGEGRH